MSHKNKPDWNADRRLDEVETFDGKLRFLIPHEWITNEEEASDTDTYSYVSPEIPGAWFRASLLSTENVKRPTARLRKIFADHQHAIDADSGNFVARSEKDSADKSTKLHIFFWKVGNAVRPSAVREALFSWTVVAEKVKRKRVQRELDLINKLVRLARFS